MAKVIKHNITYNSAPSTATLLPYNNTDSGLSATTTKGAIDELADKKADKAKVPDNLQDLDNVSISSATNGQVLKYNGTDWVNANESGGSTVSVTQIQTTGTKIATISVDSVDTDLYAPNSGGGASSLDDLTDVTITSPTTNQELAYDGSGWENKTTRVELTQIEYDNLIAQGTDLPDVDYYITDANGDGSQFQPVIYSTEEREIGVYADGKPLYQKTIISTSNLSRGAINQIALGVTDIDACVSVNGFASYGTNNTYIPLPYGDKDNSLICLMNINKASSLANVWVGSDYASPSTANLVIITLQYTKTTDTAGSGIWTPQGVPAHHYSTDEQVVGTWIDGSTLYEKTVYIPALPNNANIEYETDLSNIVQRGFDGYLIFPSGNTSKLPYINAGNTNRVAIQFNANGKIQIFTQYDNSANSAYITLRYTKSS